MPTISFVGAGSVVFAGKLIGDVLSFPELEESTIRLMDVDEAWLAKTTEAAGAMVENGGVGATTSTTDRRRALENDRRAVYGAITLDPLTAATLTLEEAHEMTEELIEANGEYLPELR